MDTRKYFEYAAIFSEEDVKDDFISCIASIMDEGDETVILVESRQSIDRIAEVQNTYESEKSKLRLQIYGDAARQYNIDAEATEVLFNVAAIIKGNMRASFEESLKIVTAITENYNMSHK